MFLEPGIRKDADTYDEGKDKSILIGARIDVQDIGVFEVIRFEVYKNIRFSL